VKFAFIAAEKTSFPVSMLCAVLEVSRSGFYEWLRRPPSSHDIDDERLKVHIKAIFRRNQGRYGAPRIHDDLRDEGFAVSRKRVARLMTELGLRSVRKRRFKPTTDSSHKLPVAPNVLARRFEAEAPDKAWVTDITQVWTSEGWLFVAAILDVFSRRVVGFAMSDRIDRDVAVDALRMALGRRLPNAGLVHHSDRGVQYASTDYQRILEDNGVVCSMSRKGNCWDNAVAESFFATLKTELVYQTKFRTRLEAKRAIFDFIEAYYNHRRRHSALGNVSPMEFEKRFVREVKNAA
jgi:transposase InsO family protein